MRGHFISLSAPSFAEMMISSNAICISAGCVKEDRSCADILLRNLMFRFIPEMSQKYIKYDYTGPGCCRQYIEPPA